MVFIVLASTEGERQRQRERTDDRVHGHTMRSASPDVATGGGGQLSRAKVVASGVAIAGSG